MKGIGKSFMHKIVKLQAINVDRSSVVSSSVGSVGTAKQRKPATMDYPRQDEARSGYVGLTSQ